MTAVKQITALARDRAGKGAARAVRREGRVPAVIYGGGDAPQTISLDYKETNKLIYAGHFLTTIFEIEVDGKKTRAIPRDYQLDPVKDTPVHIDFLRITRGQNLTVNVPVHVVDQDKAPGLKDGGVLQIIEHTLSLSAPADAIPEAINVSVGGLNVGETVHLQDIKLPKGVTAVSQENLTLVSLLAPTVPSKADDAADAAVAAAQAAGAAAGENK